MKKIFLAICLNFFYTSTVFAGANPFAEVPASHWSYDSLMKLASAGIVEGYGDGTFRGERKITRYEMAQAIARAFAKNPSGAAKFELEKLSAEFREELENFGVRIENLEKNSDKLTWHGGIGYEYLHTRIDGGIKDGTSGNEFKIELYPRAEINENWSANAKFEAYTNLNYKSSDADEDEQEVSLERIFAQGNYKNFQVKFGKLPIFSENDSAMIIDGEASGAQIIFGDKYKFKVFGGNYSGNDYFFAEIFNNRDEKFNFGVGYHRLKNSEYRNIITNTNGFYDSDVANIFSAGMKYNFGEDFALAGSFAQNPSGKNYASTQRRAYSVEISYKGAEMSEPGSYGIFAAYRKFGHMAVIEPTYDGFLVGLQGFHVGAEYVFEKNFSAEIQYFHGERVSPRYQGKHTNKIYTKVEWDF